LWIFNIGFKKVISTSFTPHARSLLYGQRLIVENLYNHEVISLKISLSRKRILKPKRIFDAPYLLKSVTTL